jgi:hypothetical protein
LAGIAPLSEGQDREENPAASCGPKIAPKNRKELPHRGGAWNEIAEELERAREKRYLLYIDTYNM